MYLWSIFSKPYVSAILKFKKYPFYSAYDGLVMKTKTMCF